jgi:hypothetical protein
LNILFSSLSGQDLTESLHYARVLERLGHQVYRFVLSSPVENPDLGLQVEPGFAANTPLEAFVRLSGFQPDLFLYVDPLGLIPKGLEKAPFPTACILCDTHTDLTVRLRHARFFDHVFLYHRNYLRHFQEHPTDYVHWLPYACDLELFHSAEVERDIEVGFVGLPQPRTNRGQIVEMLRKRYRMNDQRYYFRAEIPEIYQRSKIVVNIPLADDLNFRTFEAMSCGALLLTKRIANGQELLFEENKHYVAYADEQELLEKVGYYLAHPAERAAIAATGLAEIQSKHRLEQRIEDLLNVVGRQPGPAAPIRHMKSDQVDQEYAWLYEHLHRSIPAPGLALIRQARRQGRSWLPLLPAATRSILRTILR